LDNKSRVNREIYARFCEGFRVRFPGPTRHGDGLCLFAKRLERGRFVWPKAESGTVALTRAQLSMLLEGIDWRSPVRTATPEMAV